jgi:hypothetical protein
MRKLEYAFFFLLLGLFLTTPAQSQFSYNENYYLGRAVDVIGFAPDESFEKYEINTLYFWQRGESRVTLNPAERIVNIISPKLGIGSVQIKFIAPTYEIEDGPSKIHFSTFKRGVQGILDEAGVVLAKEDRVEPSPDQQASGKKIKITRVEEAEIEEFEPVPYRTKEILDPNLERGLTRVEQSGSSGKKRLLYSVRRENGVEISNKLILEEIVEKPQDKIIHIGTKMVVLSSVSGIATATNLSNAVVSTNYGRGTLIRITNLANGKRIEKKVNYTWGSSTPPSGVVLDLSWDILSELGYDGVGRGLDVLVEEIKP